MLLLNEVEGCAGGDAVLEQVCMQLHPMSLEVCAEELRSLDQTCCR